MKKQRAMGARIKWEAVYEGIAVKWDGEWIATLLRAEGCEDALTIDGEALFWRRVCAAPAARMEMAVKTRFVPVHTMVPAVSYDGNAFGTDHEYKGYSENGVAYTFAGHRTAIPAATASWNDRVSLALCASDGDNVSGSLLPDDSGTLHRVLWPEIEEPRVLHAHSWAEAYRGEMEPRSEFTARLFIGDGVELAWRMMLRDAWARGDRDEAPCLEAAEVWRRGVSYAKRLYTEEDDGMKAFSIGFTWNGSAWVKRDKMKYEIGWCGQNASLAVSLLHQALMHDDDEAMRMGFSVLDSWLHRARSEQGFLLTRYDPPGLPIDAVNLGNAGVQFFDAWHISKRLYRERPEYRDAALEICDFAMERQQPDGLIGVSWNQDGTANNLTGTAGGFLILPLARAFLETGEARYKDAAERAFHYYYNEFNKNGYGTAGALDTYCIDKESVIPLLKGALLLHRATGAEGYLKCAEAAAYYLSTWQWHHTVKYPEDAVLAVMGYDTFGGTAVSTSHHHIDPFALSYVTELVELSRLTGDPQWERRALAIWSNGVQCISDGTLRIKGKAERPEGSQDEGYLHTRWGDFGVDDGYFSVSQWLVAWPGAFRLETLRGDLSWAFLNNKTRA